MCTSNLSSERRPTEPLERFDVPPLGGLALCHEGPRPSGKARCPIRTGDVGRRLESSQRVDREVGLLGSDGCLDQFGERTAGNAEAVQHVGCLSRRDRGLCVACRCP